MFGLRGRNADEGTGTLAYEERVARLREALDQADAVVVGAGAGLSTAAGYTYSGERFDRYFADFSARYGFSDMYSGGFYPYGSLEEQWAFWSRFIYVNRYAPIPSGVYADLLALVGDKDYFVLTTNVDHCFQRAGFAKDRLFYTQGDYGLWQCSKPCHAKTYDNREVVEVMVRSQGFRIGDDGSLELPDGTDPAMEVPAECVPHCPVCGEPMSMNLRSDDTFVEDAGWQEHARLYTDFMRGHAWGRVLYLELGVGYNTPGIIKYPFWKQTARNRKAAYACLNMGESLAPQEIMGQSILIDGDIAQTLRALRSLG